MHETATVAAVIATVNRPGYVRVTTTIGDIHERQNHNSRGSNLVASQSGWCILVHTGKQDIKQSGQFVRQPVAGYKTQRRTLITIGHNGFF